MNVAENVRVNRRTEYKFWKKKVEELVNESKKLMDEEFSRKLSEEFRVHKKLFRKEATRERGWWI